MSESSHTASHAPPRSRRPRRLHRLRTLRWQHRLRRSYSVHEEIVNTATHAMGVGLALAGLLVLVSVAVAQGGAGRVVAFSVYGTSLLIVFLASTLYHSVPYRPLKGLLQRVDYAAIYLFIAGSYTPLLLLVIGGATGWSFLAAIWSAAIFGVILECRGCWRLRKLSVLVYLALGWTCLLIFDQIWAGLPAGAITLLFGGGIIYSAGVVFFLWERLPYSHAIWHVFVLGGSACHFALYFVYVLPMR